MRRNPWLIAGALLPAFLDGALAQGLYLTGLPTANWTGVAASADGTKLVAVSTYPNGAVWTSTNSGQNWRQAQFFLPPGLEPNYWSSVASSADGTKLVIAAGANDFYGGQNIAGPVYTSTNSGTNWTSNNVPLEIWSSVACSADGATLIAVALGGPIYTSTDSGADWVSNKAPNYQWTSAACSADGTKMAAVAYHAPIYISTNSGGNWLPSHAPSEIWSGVASSSDGSKLVATIGNGPIFTSADSGANWVVHTTPAKAWTCVASSADGTRLVAGSQGGGLAYAPHGIYVSTDSGATWNSAGPTNTSWVAVASVAAGDSFLATGGSLVYAAQPTLSISNAGGNLAFAWPAAAAAFQLQQNPDLTTTNWSNVTNNPVVTNGQTQVVLTPPAGQGFYRLVHP